MTYYPRLIDKKLREWRESSGRKPLLIRGARQVGKSTAVRELAKTFAHFVEINLEKQPALRKLFTPDIDVKATCAKLSGSLSVPIVPGETLLFIDEIQVCREAIMALRYFKEDFPELHVIAAGSLLDFAIEELPSFGVGRIRSLYMYPFSFDEFLLSQGLDVLVDYKKKACADEPLTEQAHQNLIEQLRSFYLVGGMPAAVSAWNETHDYMEVKHVQRDILDTYQDDFAKYKRRISPVLLRQVLRSVAQQAGKKFVCSEAVREEKSTVVREALHLLTLAGLVCPVVHSGAHGLPLGAEADSRYVKYLFFDLGLMLTMLDVQAGEMLLSSEVDFVNKGGASEMFAGLEMMKYADCYVKGEMFYWLNTSKNSQAEVDYLTVKNGSIVPVEVKAAKQGSMQSLWIFMRKYHLGEAVRTSLENFGQLYYYDPQADNSERHVSIIPLYALSSL
ncbi:MAG: ATP-binding protein [Alloprevotella sp.]